MNPTYKHKDRTVLMYDDVIEMDKALHRALTQALFDYAQRRNKEDRKERRTPRFSGEIKYFQITEITLFSNGGMENIFKVQVVE